MKRTVRRVMPASCAMRGLRWRLRTTAETLAATGWSTTTGCLGSRLDLAPTADRRARLVQLCTIDTERASAAAFSANATMEEVNPHAGVAYDAPTQALPDIAATLASGEKEAPKQQEPLPEVPKFPPDAITQEVVETVETLYGDHPGRVTPNDLPASAADAERAWRWALDEAMPYFGPYEDAMTVQHRSLFHTRIATLLNLGRLQAGRVVHDVERAELALNSKEGFIRQVLGWREFIRHVHNATDGLTEHVNVEMSTTSRPAGGWPGAWSAAPPTVDALGDDVPLPQAYWGTASGLACLDDVTRAVVEDGWTHHIPRLMVLANLGTLIGVRPRELTDWFWAMFTDAYDWVVEPNVLAMGTYATGPLMSTKPYVCGTPYLKRMGDACKDCAFSPSSTCPISDMYWAFLARHAPLFEGNFRMAMPMRTLAKRSPEKREADARVHARVVDVLGQARALTPQDVKEARAGERATEPSPAQ